MFSKIFNSQTKTITFAAILLAASVLISRILGLVRDRLLAGTFGAGEELDIYFAAFRVPDFVYGILIMGGVSAVFLPVFSEYFEKKNGQGEKGEDAWKFTNNLLNCFLILLISLCSILAVFTPWLINLIAPGFSAESKEMTISLTRIMFLSPIFFGISSIFSGILHYFDRFFAYSLAPILYNLGIIFGILFLVPHYGLYGLAYGVILGSLLHLLIQLPAAKKSGYKYSAILNFKNFGLTKLFKLMIPRTIGAAAYHINLIVITAIASTLTIGSITIFNFANNLQYFPIGLIGVSFSIAAFPALSKSWASGLKEDFLRVFSTTFCQIIFLVIPISFLMFILRAQIVRLILGSGEFGWLETRLTAASLGIFSLGIFASALVPFLARVFYSFQNTKTPVLISLVSMALNLCLCFLFVHLLQNFNALQLTMADILKLHSIRDFSVLGLPLALSISAIFQLCLLLIFLRKKMSGFQTRHILKSFIKVLAASFLMALVAYLFLLFGAEIVNTKTTLGILLQTLLACTAACIAYILIHLFFKSREMNDILSCFSHQFIKKH